MKKLSWPATRFRRVTANAVVLAMAFVAVAACDDSTGPGAVTGVEVVVLPVGTTTTDLVRGSTVQLLAAPHDANDQFVDIPVTWTSSDNAKATVSTTGLVTIGTGAAAGGDVTITATTAGGATGTFPLNVQHPVATVTVSPLTATIRQEGTVDLDATLVDNAGATVDRTVTWTSSNTAVATVNSSTGVVSGVADGTVTITATADNTGDVADVSNTATVTVAGLPLVATVTITANSFGGIGQTIQATHTSRAASGTTISGTTATWSSSNTAVATVSSTGLVTLVGEGTASIRASVDNGIGTNIQGSLTIRSAPVLVSGVATAVPTVPSGTSKIYAIIIPAGTTNLAVSTDAGTTGDADLWLLKAGLNPPTPAGGGFTGGDIPCGSPFPCVSLNSGNAESFSYAAAAGTYPLAVHAWTNGTSFTEDVAGVTITATITP